LFDTNEEDFIITWKQKRLAAKTCAFYVSHQPNSKAEINCYTHSKCKI